MAQKNDSLIQSWIKQPGVQMVSVRNGKYKVFTQKIGRGENKLLLIPGGPGSSFEYFEIFPQWLKDDYEIIYYSPLGSFLSDQPQDSSIQVFNEYVQDLEDVRRALGLEHFYLLGHSWAGCLVLAYASKYRSHLKGVILSNATGLGKTIDEGKKMTDYDIYQQALIADIAETIPELSNYADSIRKCFITQTNQPQLMDSIMKKVRPLFVKKHFLRLATPPDAIVRTRLHSVEEKKMHWLVDDTQKQDAIPVLSAVTIPTLMIGGAYDYIPPKYEEAKRMMKNAKDVTIYITPKGSHRAMWDDSENYFNALRSFINRINKNND